MIHEKEIIYWDADRLIKEYIRIKGNVLSQTRFSHSNKETYESLSWPWQIRVQRLAAAISAFVEIDYEYSENNVGEAALEVVKTWEHNHLGYFYDDEESIWNTDAIKSKVKELVGNQEHINYCLEHCTPRSMSRMTFHFLVEARTKSEQLQCCFDGVLETNHAGGLGIDIARECYFKPLREKDDHIDELLVLLLGKPYEREISVQDLIADHHYPTATNDELYDWEIDNF